MTVGHARDWLTLHSASRETYEGIRAFVDKRGIDYDAMRQRGAEGGSTEFLWGAPTWDCPKCNAGGLPEDFAFCGNCGTPRPN